MINAQYNSSIVHIEERATKQYKERYTLFTSKTEGVDGGDEAFIIRSKLYFLQPCYSVKFWCLFWLLHVHMQRDTQKQLGECMCVCPCVCLWWQTTVLIRRLCQNRKHTVAEKERWEKPKPTTGISFTHKLWLDRTVVMEAGRQAVCVSVCVCTAWEGWACSERWLQCVRVCVSLRLPVGHS